MPAPPRLLVLYHFFHPDQVVSARLFSDFAAEQARRGWDVTALTTNRSLDDAKARYPPEEIWNGVKIHRVFRPPWTQKRPLPRLGNSAWTLAAWFARAVRLGPFDAVVIGSDPMFAASHSTGPQCLNSAGTNCSSYTSAGERAAASVRAASVSLMACSFSATRHP